MRRKDGFWKNVLAGLLMGIGCVLPGVSGGVMAVSFGLYRPMLDAVLGIAVALHILKEGGKLIWASSQGLMDEAVEQELIDQIEAVLLRHSQAHGGAVRFDSLASRRAGARSYVQLHMHAPAEWTLGRAAQARQALESELMDTVPGLHATIELLPQGLVTAFEQYEAQEKTA